MVSGQQPVPRDSGIGAGIIIPVGIAFLLVTQVRHLDGDVAAEDGAICQNAADAHINGSIHINAVLDAFFPAQNLLDKEMGIKFNKKCI